MKLEEAKKIIGEQQRKRRRVSRSLAPWQIYAITCIGQPTAKAVGYIVSRGSESAIDRPQLIPDSFGRNGVGYLEGANVYSLDAAVRVARSRYENDYLQATLRLDEDGRLGPPSEGWSP
jgi:hypothetical protein